MDQQLAKVLVATFGDAEKPGLAAGGHLAEHQPEPSRKVAPPGEGLAITDCSDQRRCIQYPDARNGREPRPRIIAGLGGEFAVYAA